MPGPLPRGRNPSFEFMTGWIGISLGDVTGVGPEVTLKALAACPKDGTRYLILGDPARLHDLNRAMGLMLPLVQFENYSQQGRFFVFNPLPQSLPEELPAGAPKAAEAALAYLAEAVRRCLAKELDAMVTAPLNKESVLRLGGPFVGQTEFISELAGREKTAMMLIGEDDLGRWLRVALATTHLPLREVADQLTREKIETAIELASDACRLLKLKRARIGVCGLNPHAGEGGKLGTEEITTIRPAVAAAQARGIDAHGPLAADTLFYQAFRGEFEAVVAMYHDQGLGPLKMIGFEKGVNWTLGLPFPRTSPDHGTAYDIAGLGIANASSMLSAIGLARELGADPGS